MLLHPEPTTGNTIIRIEPCLDDAKALVHQLQSQLHQQPNRRFRTVFTALANGDAAVGLLAFYLWRRSQRQK